MMPPRVSQTVQRVRPYGLIALIVLIALAIVLIIAYGQRREENIMAIRDERRAQMEALMKIVAQHDTTSTIEHAALNAKLDSVLTELRDK